MNNTAFQTFIKQKEKWQEKTEIKRVKNDEKKLYEENAREFGNNNNIRQMFDRTHYQIQRHGDKMCDKMDCQITFEITVPSNHPAYSKNSQKSVNQNVSIQNKNKPMSSKSSNIPGQYPPVPSLISSEQKLFPVLEKETKVMNMDFRRSGKGQVENTKTAQNKKQNG